MKKLLGVLIVAGAAALAASPAHANCGISTPVGHQFAGYLLCADRSELTAYAYVLARPSTDTTSGLIDISCEETGDAAQCNPSAGSAGDTRSAINFDWVDPRLTPAAPANCATPGQRIVIVVQAPDGTGAIASLSGASAVVAVPYSLELAHPFDPSDPLADPEIGYVPLRCSNLNGRPKITGISKSGTTITLNLSFDRPQVFSDCDANSTGVVAAGDTCNDGFVANASVQAIFTRTIVCDANADGVLDVPDTRLTGWTRSAVSPTGGTATIQIAEPAAGSCAYVGTTVNIAGTETAAIAGFIAVGGPNAASPVAQGVMAEAAKANIRVRWNTETELDLAGFNIMAQGSKGLFKVNDQLIKAKGGPSIYEEFVPRGKFQGAKKVLIQSVLQDGTTLLSAPADIR